MTDGLICVGAIAGAFGVRGEVRIKSFCAVPEAIATYAPLTSEDGSREFTIKITRQIKNGLSARVSGIDTKEMADEMKGTRLYAKRAALPSLPDDEFYYSDLQGLQVFDAGGEALGKVAAVLNHGAGDILEVRRHGNETVLVPFTKEAVPTVDLAAGRIVVDYQDGPDET